MPIISAFLTWALLLGVALRFASDSTKSMLSDVAEAVSQVVRWVIKFAPLGVMGLVFNAIAANGIETLFSYGKLIFLLVGAMFFDALVVNPIIVYIKTRQNPYPLVFKCLKDSGITAFFTRSSAANIPVNMKLCEELKLDKDTYSISIPLGATINMGGASITIAILTLAATHTLGQTVDFGTAVILCVLAAVSACGASGVAGGSLLLIPLACSLFGIPNDIAMQVVGVGFIVGVIQDSCETALNSSTDVLFTAAADIANKKKTSEAINEHKNLSGKSWTGFCWAYSLLFFAMISSTFFIRNQPAHEDASEQSDEERTELHVYGRQNEISPYQCQARAGNQRGNHTAAGSFSIEHS